MALKSQYFRFAIISILIFNSILAKSQPEPISGGVGLGMGGMLHLPGKSSTAGMLTLRLDGRIPIIGSLLSVSPNAGLEYAMLPVEASNAGKTLQTARAQFGRLGTNLNFRLYTSGKNSGIEIGGGLLFRKKWHESSDWQLTGGQAVSYYPENNMIAPVNIQFFSENDKRRKLYFAELTFNIDGNANSLNSITAGIQFQWYGKQKKHYFKGTHRTLQWDDIWKPDENP